METLYWPLAPFQDKCRVSVSTFPFIGYLGMIPWDRLEFFLSRVLSSPAGCANEPGLDISATSSLTLWLCFASRLDAKVGDGSPCWSHTSPPLPTKIEHTRICTHLHAFKGAGAPSKKKRKPVRTAQHHTTHEPHARTCVLHT